MQGRNPLHCLVPDYVLREIAKRGGDAHREAVLDTLGVSATLRSARSQAEAARAAVGPTPLASASLRPPRIDRVIRNANGGTDLASPVVRREGDPDSGDPAIDEAWEHFGSTWNFFFEVLARNSIDNAGMTLDGVVHYGRNFDNAFWDGDQMVFGDGSGQLFTRLTQSLSVCAHELGHGVIQFDGPLTYQGQSGALNEHIADAFGASTETFANEPAPFDVPDFTVGEQINLQGHGPIRNMANPAAISGHPNCFSTSTPNLEVHAAAGPGNHWFYLLAEGSNPPGGQPTSPTCNGLPVFGIGVPAAIRILYSAMLMKTSGSSYAKYRTWTLQAAKNLWPGSCRRFDAVKAAWDAVSVPAQSADPTCTTNRPAPSSDILWRNTTTNQFVEWLMSDGEVGASVTLFTEPAAWHVQGTGDFNGDGTDDILWRNVDTGEFVEWLMSNGNVAANIPLFTEPAEWQVQGIGDFNGDGTSDILWRNVNTGQFAEWLMSNGGVGSVITLFTEPAEWQVQGIGDFNGDGSSDILWHNVNTGEFSEWLMVNGGVGASIPLFTEPAEWHVQGIGDFNGDDRRTGVPGERICIHARSGP